MAKWPKLAYCASAGEESINNNEMASMVAMAMKMK
jgi:hypothetical protein